MLYLTPFGYARVTVFFFCAFLDIRNAFDVAWRDGALLKLHRAGIPLRLWHLVDDMVTDRTATVRIGACFSEPWDVESGIGQGAVLSEFLFNILINGLAAAIKRVCPGVWILTAMPSEFNYCCMLMI